MNLLAKSGSYRSYENGDITSYIRSYMNTLEKASSPHRFAILRSFQNQDRFTIPKSGTCLAEKREGDHRQSQSVIRSRKRNTVGERLCNIDYCKYDKCFLMQANYKI